MLSKEIVAEGHIKSINTELLAIKVGGTCAYHWALKG
jgi:hypothetical protein